MSVIYTIGHSTRSIEEFIGLLHQHWIQQLVDIRTVPRSRYNPQYEQHALRESLAGAGIAYHYVGDLGGLRPKVSDSVNTAWRNQSFQNYADYMQTRWFKLGLDQLMRLASEATTAIMCAEAVPWRCHRSLVADALLIRDYRVVNIISATNAPDHMLTSFAKAEGFELTYPAQVN